MTQVHDNQYMDGQAAPSLGRHLTDEFLYALASFPLAVVSFPFALVMLWTGPTWALSAPVVRRLAAANRFLAWKLLGERVPAPPPARPDLVWHVRTPDAGRFSSTVEAAGGRVRQWAFSYGDGISVRGLSPARITELAVTGNFAVSELRAGSLMGAQYRGAVWDKTAWRARLYIAAKLPLAVAGLAFAAAGLDGLACLTFPVWREFTTVQPFPFGGPGYFATFGGSLTMATIGGLLLVAAPWLLHRTAEGDKWLVRSLLGPALAAGRIQTLEETRTIAVEDSAVRLRGIERDLHDGAQAQLVALSMKLGLAKEKLADAAPVDLGRITQLVEDAHRAALEAIVELRTLARGIHPPVLDNGLADALAALAQRSAVPVELVTDIGERPSDAIETIAYFSAAELLANVAKHSGARQATLEAVHVPGLLRIRVTDDGRGGARPVADGGLRGLVGRVRTVDGRLEIDSPAGGPTAVTVELPSRA